MGYQIVNNEAPSEPVKADPASPITQDKFTEPGADLEGPVNYDKAAKMTLDSFMDKAIKTLNVPKTEENMMKIVKVLNAKMDGWLAEGFALENDADVVETILENKGMEKTAANYRKIIELLLENK